MTNVIRFRPRPKIPRRITPSLISLIDTCMALGILVSCQKTSGKSHEDALYRVVFCTPGEHVVMSDVSGYELAARLDGMLLGYAIAKGWKEY